MKTNTSGTLKAPMSYGVLQRVRSGVLIETYYLSGVQNADKKSSMTITQKRKVDPGVQRVLLQVLSYNPPQDLIALDRDVALAVYFTPSGAPNQELRSKYIYLTDAGYTDIKPGQLLELDFDLGDVGEIRGINVVKTGSLGITFENALIVTQKTSGEIVDQYSIEKGFMPSSTPSRVNVTGEVELLKLDIRTALDTENTSSGTKDPVRMTIGYYDVNGAEQTETIGNIRPYIEADKALVSGQTDILKILISRLASVRYITFEPYDSDSATIASWTLASVSATVGLDGAPVSRQVNKTIVEETPETIFLTDMIVLSTIRVSTSSGEPTANEPEFYVKATPDSTAERRTEASIKSPEIGTLTVDSGALLGLSTRVSGSSKGFSVKFMQIDPVSGLEEAADLSEETYSYKDEELDEIYQLAIQSIGPEVTNEQEIEAAKTVIELINTMRSGKGSFTAPDDSDTGGSKSIIFQTPRNYSDQKLQYRIIVTAKENTTASYTLDIIVGKEEDQLGKAIEAWEKVRSVGSVSVLNTSGGVEETSDLKQSDQKSLLIDSGEGVKVVPRVAESEGFTAVVNSYDPATQAKGRADLLVRHSYSEDTLLRYESEANTILSAAESTDDERTEAQNVLNIISAMRAGAGSFTSGTSEILLNAPKNYTGSTVSYIVTVTNSSTNAELFSLIVTVNSETDTLQTAYSQMQTAKASGDQERVDAKAAGQQQNNADNTNTDSNTNNNSGDTTGGDANTGDTGNVEGGNTGEGEGGENAGN